MRLIWAKTVCWETGPSDTPFQDLAAGPRIHQKQHRVVHWLVSLDHPTPSPPMLQWGCWMFWSHTCSSQQGSSSSSRMGLSFVAPVILTYLMCRSCTQQLRQHCTVKSLKTIITPPLPPLLAVKRAQIIRGITGPSGGLWLHPSLLLQPCGWWQADFLMSPNGNGFCL